VEKPIKVKAEMMDEGLGSGLVQVKDQTDKGLSLRNAYLISPFEAMFKDAAIVALSAYAFYRSPYWAVRAIAAVFGLSGISSLLGKLTDIGKEPAQAVQFTKPSYEV